MKCIVYYQSLCRKFTICLILIDKHVLKIKCLALLFCFASIVFVNIVFVNKFLINIYRTAIGIRGKDGIVFGVEKLVTSKLYETGANKRIFNIDRHIGMVIDYLLCMLNNDSD